MVCFEKFFLYSIGFEGVPRSWLIFRKNKFEDKLTSLELKRSTLFELILSSWFLIVVLFLFSIWLKSRCRWFGFSKSILAWFANWEWSMVVRWCGYNITRSEGGVKEITKDIVNWSTWLSSNSSWVCDMGGMGIGVGGAWGVGGGHRDCCQWFGGAALESSGQFIWDLIGSI